MLSNDTITLRFFLRQMTLLKTSIENSVKFIPSTNSSPIEKSYNHKPETVSNPRKQNKKLSLKFKKCYRRKNSEGFRIIK